MSSHRQPLFFSLSLNPRRAANHCPALQFVFMSRLRLVRRKSKRAAAESAVCAAGHGGFGGSDFGR
jgi:hypothetical protein